MSTRTLRRAAAAFLVAGLMTAPLAAQQPSIGIGSHYLGYSFDEGLGADAAQLLITPVAIRFPLSESFTLDLYGAWAQGKVERDDIEYSLNGPVDTRVKASYQATPWAILSVGVSLPTGNATHDTEEAVVTSVLATDLLGFREATWGTGLAVTSSVATAMRAGGWGIGLAGAYAVRNEFEPSSELDLKYQPGNESRVRIGLDRNIGTNTFTTGVTFMTYEQDQADGRNLFQAGNRLRVDASYLFRAGAGVWTLYAADLWRENGDLTATLIGENNQTVGDTTLVTPKQNLVVAGFIGSVGLGGSYIFRPHVDFKYQTREADDGSTEGSGWIVAAGGDLPVRLFGTSDFFPKVRVLWGSIEGTDGENRNLMGAELSATVRWSF